MTTGSRTTTCEPAHPSAAPQCRRRQANGTVCPHRQMGRRPATAKRRQSPSRPCRRRRGFAQPRSGERQRPRGPGQCGAVRGATPTLRFAKRGTASRTPRSPRAPSTRIIRRAWRPRSRSRRHLRDTTVQVGPADADTVMFTAEIEVVESRARPTSAARASTGAGYSFRHLGVDRWAPDQLQRAPRRGPLPDAALSLMRGLPERGPCGPQGDFRGGGWETVAVVCRVASNPGGRRARCRRRGQ